MKKLNLRILLSSLFLFVFATASSAQGTFYFPQIADGTFAGGYFTTTILVANPASAGSANVTITFTQSNGSAFNLSFVDANNNPVPMAGNVLTLTALAAGQSRKLVSTAAIPLSVGFATVTSDANVSANAIFSQFSGSPGSGTLLSEAAVVPATPQTNQAIFVDQSGNFRTGFAYANPSVSTPANITFRLLNTAGVSTLTTARMLAATNHTAIFVDELFSTNGTTNPLAIGHVGRMEVLSDQGLPLMALRFEGSIFTTVPPFQLAGIFGTFEHWLNTHALPGPLETMARLVIGWGSPTSYGLG